MNLERWLGLTGNTCQTLNTRFQSESSIHQYRGINQGRLVNRRRRCSTSSLFWEKREIKLWNKLFKKYPISKSFCNLKKHLSLFFWKKSYCKMCKRWHLQARMNRQFVVRRAREGKKPTCLKMGGPSHKSQCYPFFNFLSPYWLLIGWNIQNDMPIIIFFSF